MITIWLLRLYDSRLCLDSISFGSPFRQYGGHSCLSTETDNMAFLATQGAFSQRRCGESPRLVFQRVSSEDCTTPVRGLAVKSRVPSFSLPRTLPSSLWGKSPCGVSESAIGRLQHTSSWTGNEAEYRVFVCVGVLRNSTQEQSLPIANRARLTVVKLHLSACSHRHCGESPRVKFQRVSSEDCSTPVRGLTVKQNAEIRSAFFATAQMLIFHIFSSVHPFSCRGHGIRDSRFLGKSVVRQ